MKIACLACGEEKRLRGVRTDQGIQVTCGACGRSWLRTPYTCPGCGAETLTDTRVPILQKARGSQQSITGYRIVKECSACGTQTGDPTQPQPYTRD
jgi:transcription elongation factor Elf1